MSKIKNKLFFEKTDFDDVKNCKSLELENKLSVVADMVRLNSLVTIMNASSGHIGASFSAVEVLTALYHHIMNVDPSKPKLKDRDIFILSKGHAAATLYTILASRGFMATEKLAMFRRLGGLEGHAEKSALGVDSNTGSLGIGISKAKGFAWVHKSDGVGASTFVMVGDGELQEGQNWEAIQSAGFWKLDNLYLLIDQNHVQTDTEVDKILGISPIKKKLENFGWHVVEIDGHGIKEILKTFEELKKISGKPKAIVLNTVKGKGVSFMEHPKALRVDGGVYKWHDKLPNAEKYELAWKEIISRIKQKTVKCEKKLTLPIFQNPPKAKGELLGESLLKNFSKSLVHVGEKNKNLVVLDADLAECCGLREFQNKWPKRFIEIGIAEQDMVSMAGGLALAGKLPVVNTFTSFLTSRANEQIFNNASEGTKIIYVGHLAGILPAKPGKSHQGIRDISLLKAIPNMLLCAPCNALELRELLEFLTSDAKQSGYIRIEHSTPKRNIRLPTDYKLEIGKGTTLADGNDAVVFGYGPLMLAEALSAREELEKIGVKIKVVNLPWLNCVDKNWIKKTVGNTKYVFCLENHSITAGQSEEIARILVEGDHKHISLYTIGICGYGRSGENDEILKHYQIGSLSIADRIRKELKREKS